MNEPKMKQVFVEYVIPDIVYGEYEKLFHEFCEKLGRLHGLTFDSFQVREFEIDEIPF